MNYDISDTYQYSSFMGYLNLNNNLNNIDNSNTIYRPINNSFRNILLNNLSNIYGPSLNQENNLIRSSFEEKPKYKKIITQEAYNNLQKIKFNKYDNNLKNNSCPIYYLEFEDGEEITKLPCEHCFNSEAIKKWLFQENNHCPVCRTELESIEIKIDNQTIHTENNNQDLLLESNQPSESPSLSQHNDFYPILENNNEEIQNIINNIYNRSNSNGILQYLRDYVNDNNEEDNNREDNNREDNNEEDNNIQNNNINNTDITNFLNTFQEQLTNNINQHFINYYDEEIFSRDLEEAIARSLEQE
jgi:hypothetical protein